MESENRSLHLRPWKWTAPALGATLTVAPFLVLEAANRGFDDFPVPLFGVMWLLALSSALLSVSILPLARPGSPGGVGLVVRTVLLVAAVMAFVAVVVDQMPCFLGQPNCD